MRFDHIFGTIGSICIVLLCGHAYAPGPELHSVYTSLQHCEAVERLELPERTLERAKGTGISRCPGANGYSIYVIDDDPRSWLVLQHDRQFISLERHMVAEFKLGNFPNVAGANLAEWRVDGTNKVVGLIVRVTYQRTDVSANSAAAQASVLLAFEISGAQPILLGSTPNNAEARELVDKAER